MHKKGRGSETGIGYMKITALCVCVWGGGRKWHTGRGVPRHCIYCIEAYKKLHGADGSQLQPARPSAIGGALESTEDKITGRVCSRGTRLSID
jgi:hypothetical protein